MSEINDWNIAAANNNDTPPDGWPESTMQYSEVNNTAREGMAVVARFWKDLNGSLQFAGPADAYTVTLNAAYAAYFQGMYFAAEINITNTGAVTIDVNALGVKTVVDQASAALTAGDLVAGGLYEFRYDGTNFQLLASTLGDDSITTAMIIDGAVTLPKMADMATDSFIGRDTAGTGVPEILSAAVARGVLNVEDDSAADQTAGEIEAIVNHDNLLGFVSEEHIRWDLTGGEDIHVDRIPLATESAVGGLEVATQAETDAGVLDNKIVTPEKLAAFPVSSAGGESKFKTADTSRASQTTPSDDPHLNGFSIDANTHYKVEGCFSWFSNVGDIEMIWQFDNAPVEWFISHTAFSNPGGGDPHHGTIPISGNPATAIRMTQEIDNIEHSMVIHGFMLSHASLSATLDFQWAQDTTSTNATIIRAGSWITVTALN